MRVYAGPGPASGKDHYQVETVPPDPNAMRQTKKLRARLLNQIDDQCSPMTNATLAYLIDH